MFISNQYEKRIKNDFTHGHRGAVRINRGTTNNKYTKMETLIKRERTTETETTALNKTIPNYQGKRQQAHEYETPGVVFYLLSVQFISPNESIISII